MAPPSHRRAWPLRALGWLFTSWCVALYLVMAVGAVVLGIALANYVSYSEEMPPIESMHLDQPSAGALIVDRNGEPLYQYVDDVGGIRIPVALDQVSPEFLAATIATEDLSFFRNPGVNLKGLGRAARDNLNVVRGGVLEGAGGSSITQQLVKNVYIPFDQRAERTLDRKAREIVYAIELTKRYDKTQILQWYVNQVNYGGLYVGVEAASKGYFGKHASELTLAEATLLAGIPQSPAAYDPRGNPEAAAVRRDTVLDLMLRAGAIQIGTNTFYTVDPAALDTVRATPVEVRDREDSAIEAPHFIFSYIAPQLEQLVGEDAMKHAGLRVTTTLDLNLQHKAEQILERWISEFEKISNSHNGAALVMVPNSGEILAMIGSRAYFRDDIQGEVNNLLTGNSPGSTFKPFVYLTAFHDLKWNASTIIQDTPVSFREDDGTVFSPTNPNKNYNGPITLRNALGNSLNVPAFKTAQQLGWRRIVEFAKSVGFTGLDRDYGPSIAIGGVELKAIDLTYGYGVIANGGVLAGQDSIAPDKADERRIQPVAILKIEDASGRVIYDANAHRRKQQALTAEHALMISDILSDPSAQCITFGCGGLNVPGYKVAVKTGTSEPFDPKGPDGGKIGETWAFGFTSDLVVGVWAGNADNAPVINIFSTSISWRAMRDILLAAYGGRPQTPFPKPPGSR